MKFVILSLWTTAGEPSRPGVRYPTRRCAKLRTRTPVRTLFVVFLEFTRIAKDFVSLIDVFKLILGLLLVFRHIRVIFPGQFSKCFLYLRVSGCARHSQ